MNKRQTAGILALLAVLLAVWAGAGQFKNPGNAVQEEFAITALSVGKADALIVQEADQAILIDAGEQEDGDEIVRALKERGVRRINLFLVTHYDRDHVGGAAYVMEHMEVDAVMMPDYEGDRPEYRDFLACLEGRDGVRRLTEKTELSIGHMQVIVYPADDSETIQDTAGEYDNNLSLVTSIHYGKRGFLLTGDIEKERMKQMLSAGTDWHHDWIKMPHHGRYQKALADFLEAVSPKEAVICCSGKNPAEEKTLKLLEEKEISVWDTSERAVVTVCDGENIRTEYD